MSRRLSFTERRRARQAMKFGRLDQLETRNTMTEPISVTALSFSAFRTLAQLGIMQADGGNGDLFALTEAARRAQQGLVGPHPAALLPNKPASIPIGFPATDTPRASGGGGSAPGLANQVPAQKQSQPADWLALTSSTDSASSQSQGLTTPWHPAARAGGGAALPPRGGSGNGAQSATVALVAGHGGHAKAASPSAPATIPGYMPGKPYQTIPPNSAHSSPAPVVTRNAAATALAQGGGSTPAAAVSVPVVANTGPTPVPVIENPSSMPSSTTGNSSGAAMGSFTYFPLYTLDYNQGTVLFPGGYQLATQGGSMDLRAQTTGTTGVTYSWNTSGLTNATSITGATTFDLTFTWSTTVLMSPQVDSVTLTATNGSLQQESQTYYFVVPTTTSGSGSAPTWPTTLSPDIVGSSAPSWSGDGVSVNADSGALDTTITLPTYNPNVGALALTYDSLTTSPEPIIVVPHTLDPTKTVPSEVSAQLTFDGTALTTYYYNTSQWTPGDVEQIALQATNATSLATGRYAYSVQVIDYRSGTPTTFTYSGTATVLNQSSSALGDGWSVEGLEQITTDGTSGVILSLGVSGESLFFSGSPSVGSNYTKPAGNFSTLTLTSSGYTQTLPDGTKINFNSSGYQTATIDLNNNHTTYSYNGSNQLTSIEDQYGGFTTLTYSSGKLSTILDPAGRLATFTMSSGNLAAVQQADGTHVSYTYNGSGLLTQVKDPMSDVVSIVYDSAGRVGTITQPDLTTEEFSADQEQGWTNSGTSGSPAAATLLAAAGSTFTDANSNVTTIRPDWLGLGTVGQLTDALGDTETFDYNPNGLPTIVIDNLNRITQYTYNSQGNITEEIFPDGTNVQSTYNSFSEPLTYTNEDGNTTSYTYNADGDLTVEQDALHNLTTMTYTATGQVQTVTDANNHTTTYQYDSQDRLTTMVNADSTTEKFVYNSQGNVIKVTDERNNSTTYSFDAMNRETGTTDALGDIATYVYNADGDLTQDQEPTPAGQTARTTLYTYNSMNRLTVETDPLGLATTIGYDADGNQTSVKDPLGRITTTVFDALNRPVVVIDPMGNHVTTTYDADGETLTVTDALNRTTTYTYSVRGWVATVTDPMDFVATYTYTPTGKNSATYEEQTFMVTVSYMTYDADDRLIGQANGLDQITTTTYDGVGNVTSVEDANTNVVTYVYNSRNELIEEIEPLGVTVSYTYDASGNQQTVTDALGHTTTTLYDALDRATTIISAVSGTTTIAYDSAGRETSLTDPDGNKTQWAYDSDDRLTTMTEPNSSTVTYVYDNDGELTDTTDEDGRRTTYSYNADGDQTGETWIGASPSEKITYIYDADNEMTGAADSFATLTFTYNADGELQTDVTSGPGSGQPMVTLTYGYDQLGDETSVTDSLSSQGITTYTFNAARQMTEITTSYGGTAGPQVSYDYDNAGRLTSISRQIGSSGEATEVNTTITYDNANRVVTMTDGVSSYNLFPPGWSTSPLATYVYSYDDASRVTSETDAEGTYTYTYDNANELTTVTENSTVVGSYSYDANGNRNSTGYTTGTDNEQTASPGYTYTYDNAGNMISDTNTSTHVATTYTYDFRNRLTEVTTGGTVVATYTYNALNQRIGVKEGGSQTWTIYDGTSPDANPYADFNGSGMITERYLFGPSVVTGAVMTGILARTSSGGTTDWYLTDNLGSVRDIVDSSGNELDHIVYDSFGNIVTETNATNGDRFKFAVMQYDATIGQYYDHARWYVSSVGRFSQQDPMGFGAGDNDLYRYVGNQPISSTDPTGKFLGMGMPNMSDYWYYLQNPAAMDGDLQNLQQAALATAAISITVASGGTAAGAAALEAGLSATTAVGIANTAAAAGLVGAMAGGTYAALNGNDPVVGALGTATVTINVVSTILIGRALVSQTLQTAGLAPMATGVGGTGVCFVAGTPVLSGEPADASRDEGAGAAGNAGILAAEFIAAAIFAACVIPLVGPQERAEQTRGGPEPNGSEDDSDGRAEGRGRRRAYARGGSGQRGAKPRPSIRNRKGATVRGAGAGSRRGAGEVRTRRRRALLALGLAAFMLLGMLFACNGTSKRRGTGPVADDAARGTAAARPIEKIQVGQRVLTSAAQIDGGTIQFTSVDARTWRRLRLQADNRWADGTLDVIEVETLQPPEWIEAHHAQPGALVPLPLDLQEMGLPQGLLARVQSNQPCPALEQRPGTVVTTTVSHLNSDVWEVDVVDQRGRCETIRPTGFHKFYSASRDAWVSTKDLVPGEQLPSKVGHATVRSVARIPGVHRVYNMTVEGDHVYRVSNFGVLVHNNGCSTPQATPISMDEALDKASAHLGPGNVILDTTPKGNYQFRMQSVDSAGNTVQKMARFDVNPADDHVAQSFPHLNLETQINGKGVGNDPHIPIDPATIRPWDYQMPSPPEVP